MPRNNMLLCSLIFHKMKYKTRIFQKHWGFKTNFEFSVDCKWTLKQRSSFQLSTIIKDMSCVNNIDQKNI